MTQKEYTNKINKFGMMGDLAAGYVSKSYDGYEMKTMETSQSYLDCGLCLAGTKAG